MSFSIRANLVNVGEDLGGGAFRKEGHALYFGKIQIQESRSGVPYLDVSSSWEAPPALVPFIASYTLWECFRVGGAPRVRGEYEEGGAKITLDDHFGGGEREEMYSLEGESGSIKDLVALRMAIRTGKAVPKVPYDGPTATSARIADLEANVRGCEARIIQLDIQVKSYESIVDQRDDEKRALEKKVSDLETDLRLMRERVTALLGNIWGDLLKIRWWQGKKALRVVGLDIRAEPLLANLMSEADKMSLRRGISADS